MAAPSVVDEERISSIPKYVNEVLETTFCGQITFGLARRGQKWSKLAYFHKGGPCREQ